jgi:dihydrofolate reductase
VISKWSDHGKNTRDIEVQRSALADEILHAAGAILGGRRWHDVAVRKFDGYDGIYGGHWKGPVFVLSHRPADAEPHRAVTFISGTVSEAVATAKDAAAGKTVVIFGANLAAQCLRRGLLDEIAVHLAPVLLGEGVRLYDTHGIAPVELRRTLVASSGQITDPRFVVRHADEQSRSGVNGRE